MALIAVQRKSSCFDYARGVDFLIDGQFRAGYSMVTLMATPAFDRHYYNPGNWKLGFIYFCPSDKRLIVPKRIRALGWTLNFARPLAVPFVSFMGALVLAVLDLIGSFGIAGDFQMACELPLIFALIALCCRLAKPRHAG